MAAPGTHVSSATPNPRDRCLLDTLERQHAVLATMAAEADVGENEFDRCLRRWGLKRQSQRYGRDLALRSRGPASRRWHVELGAHAELVRSFGEAAETALAMTPARSADAEEALGLRVAVVGKGGAGKSMISGTLARLLARRGRRVLAADFDTNPGLTYSLGAHPATGALAPEAVEAHDGASYGWRLASGLSPAEAVERFSVEAPDGVRFLALGKIDDRAKTGPKRTVVALREILLGFGDPTWDVVGDLEAGPTTPFERYHAFADVVVVVVGPAWRSAMTARRLLPIVADVPTLIVASQFRHEPDHPGLTPVMRVPLDPDARAAERAGLAPLDCCPDSPAMVAISALADLLSPPSMAARPARSAP